MRKVLLASVVLIFILSSCVHKTPFKDEYYFQALGSDSEIVITADVKKLNETENFKLNDKGISAELSKRGERFSLGLEPTNLEKYPLEITDYVIYGAAEGNFGKSLVNTALSLSKDFSKEKKDGYKYYVSDNLEVGVPVNGVLLFSSSTYLDALEKTILNREKRISDENATIMADKTISVFINRPETLLDLGFELPQTTLNQIEECLLFIEEDERIPYMSGTLLMWSESGARTMNTLLRNQLIQSIRRSGGKVDVKELAHFFNYDGRVVTIDKFTLEGEMLDRAKALISSLN